MGLNMSERLRIGVFGAGHLGRIHIQQLKELPELGGGRLLRPASGEMCGDHGRVRGECLVSEPDELFAKVDVVDIVTPTLSHFALASSALIPGKHVFIEKPLTKTVAEAEDLVALATKHDRTGASGPRGAFQPRISSGPALFRGPDVH